MIPKCNRCGVDVLNRLSQGLCTPCQSKKDDETKSRLHYEKPLCLDCPRVGYDNAKPFCSKFQAPLAVRIPSSGTSRPIRLKNCPQRENPTQNASEGRPSFPAGFSSYFDWVRGPAVRLREDPTRLTPIDATTEELLEACERARAGDAAAKIIANLREEVSRLCETIDDLREQIAEELNQEPPTRQRSTPP